MVAQVRPCLRIDPIAETGRRSWTAARRRFGQEAVTERGELLDVRQAERRVGEPMRLEGLGCCLSDSALTATLRSSHAKRGRGPASSSPQGAYVSEPWPRSSLRVG
jgi:hypothetical protein